MNTEGQNRQCGRGKESGSRAACLCGYGRRLCLQLPVKGPRSLRTCQVNKAATCCDSVEGTLLECMKPWVVSQHRKEGRKEGVKTSTKLDTMFAEM